MILMSVALVTRNRPDSLAQTLKSLREQSVQPYEVVISDDSEGDAVVSTRVVAERWGCRYIRGPRRGLYANRNHVALACQGTHIRTMDDDHRFPAGHFEMCLRAVESDPNSIWTTGEIGFIEGKEQWRCPTANQLNAAGVGGKFQNLDDNWSIADGSTIYPAIIFQQGHRMVEWYNYGSSYLEFGAYLYCLGFKSRCIQNALIEHYPLDSSILSRSREIASIETHLFGSFCYHLYFHKQPIGSIAHVLSKGVKTGFSEAYLRSIKTSWQRANLRLSMVQDFKSCTLAASGSPINELISGNSKLK